MLAWLIGCSTHGVSQELLAETKDALRLLNDLTSDGIIGDDFYQAPDFAAGFQVLLQSEGTHLVEHDRVQNSAGPRRSVL